MAALVSTTPRGLLSRRVWHERHAAKTWMTSQREPCVSEATWASASALGIGLSTFATGQQPAVGGVFLG